MPETTEVKMRIDDSRAVRVVVTHFDPSFFTILNVLFKAAIASTLLSVVFAPILFLIFASASFFGALVVGS